MYIYMYIHTAWAPPHPDALLSSAILETEKGKLPLPIQRLGLQVQENASNLVRGTD